MMHVSPQGYLQLFVCTTHWLAVTLQSHIMQCSML